MAVVVLCSIFLLQVLLLLPLMWSSYNASVDALVEQERSSLQKLLNFNNPENLNNPQNLINTAMVGLLMTDSAGNPVITQGELPEFESLIPGHCLSARYSLRH